MADIEIRSFKEPRARVAEGGVKVEEEVDVFELRLRDQINGKPVEFSKRYDVEPTNEQRAAFEGEAREHFERNAKRDGVVLDDPGVTPAAQPVHSDARGPATTAKKQPKGTTAKK